MKLGLQGYFDIFKKKSDGSIIEEYHFKNLILDSGLELIGSLDSNESFVVNYCFLGAGNDEPQVKQVGLIQKLGDKYYKTYNVQWSLDTEEKSVSVTRSYRFDAGDATGNIAEIGVSKDRNIPLFSRALIKDSQGRPTVITKLADEILDVYYTLKIIVPHQDTTGVCTISGEQYNYIMRPAYLGGGASYPTNAFAGELGEITRAPSGYISSGGGNFSRYPYSPSSYKKKVRLSYAVDNANHENGIRSVVFYGLFGTFWQCQFSRVSDGKAIPKDNTKTLSLDFELSWGRADVT